MSAPDSDDPSSPVAPESSTDPDPASTDRPSPDPAGPSAESSPTHPSAAERERSAAAAHGGPSSAAPDTSWPAEPLGPPESVVADDGDVAAGTASEGEEGPDEDVVASAGPELGAADAWPADEALEAVELDDAGWTRRGLEAILLVADEPVPAATLAELVGARLTEVEALLIDLAGEYAGQARGFVLRAVAGGWRLYTHPAARDVVDAYLRAGQQSRLTRAALETLAVVAYRQPVTRHQVGAVRGVNVDGVFRTLATRGLIHEVGHEEGPGQAALYGTTPAFLEQLGLNGLDQLPPIKDYLPEGVDLMDLLEQM